MDDGSAPESCEQSFSKTKEKSCQTKMRAMAREARTTSKLVTLSLFAFTLIPYLGPQWMICELCSHFRLQYAVLLLFAVIILAVQKHRYFLIVAGLALLVNGLELLPFVWPNERSASLANLRVITANVNSKNRAFSAIKDAIETEKADLVFLQEVTPELAAYLTTSLKTLPFNIVEARNDNFGMAIFSKYALIDPKSILITANIDEEKKKAIALEQISVPLMRAEILFQDQKVRIINVHTVPPLGGWLYDWRNDYMRQVATMTSEFNGPVIVAGDFNCTLFSPVFKTFLAQARTVDSEQGFGIQPSWPGQLWPLKIPIDHVLLKGDMIVLERKLLPHIGSDHSPVVVSLSLSQ